MTVMVEYKMSDILSNQILIFGIIVFILFLLWLLSKPVLRAIVTFNLKRVTGNPVLSPHELTDWETHSVFNPGAFMDDEGIVHLLYRAVGMDGLSKIGHAQSCDGKSFERRFGFPVFQKNHFEHGFVNDKDKVYSPAKYTSGGGWGGSEDPRTVCIDDTVYMSYTAFEGWHSVRIALTSIGLEDFKKGKWNWNKPKLLSAPNTVEKNWVLFPEKINGKFAVLHSISPLIKIDYVESFDSYGQTKFIESQNAPTKGGRETHWDNWMRGAAAPPIKTRLGWLLLYHAMDRNDPNKYKLGAMILDAGDPTKILYRSPSPILSPETHYENDGKPGVIYASGAVVINNDLHVYYGGGDKYICVANTHLDDLLNWLIDHGRV